jgi:NADP-reducing hydrogenase subunit HndD
MYEEFFGTPNSHQSHKYLHTHYMARENYPEKA